MRTAMRWRESRYTERGGGHRALSKIRNLGVMHEAAALWWEGRLQWVYRALAPQRFSLLVRRAARSILSLSLGAMQSYA